MTPPDRSRCTPTAEPGAACCKDSERMDRRPPARRSLLRAASLALLLGRLQMAHGAGIVAVRIWPAPEASRVTIESDEALSAQPFFVATPPRLAVDIEGADLSPARRALVAKVRFDDPNIAGSRVGQNAPGVVRLVIDLKQAALPQVFTLPPVAAYRHRLVLDLYPAAPMDPLQALTAERLRAAPPPPATAAPAPAPETTAQAPAPPTAPDPLDALIAQHSNHRSPPPAETAPPTLAAAPISTAPAAPAPPLPAAPAAPARPTVPPVPPPPRRTGTPRQPRHGHTHRSPHHRGAGPRPRRRRPWRHRPCGHARERRGGGRGAVAAPAHQRHHRGRQPDARLPDARRRLLRPPGHARAKSPPSSRRPLPEHPCRRIHHPRSAGRQRVCAQPERRIERGSALDGEQGKPIRSGGRHQCAAASARPVCAVHQTGHEHHRADQGQPPTRPRAAGRDRPTGPVAQAAGGAGRLCRAQ